jgi:hypothetical protein
MTAASKVDSSKIPLWPVLPFPAKTAPTRFLREGQSGCVHIPRPVLRSAMGQRLELQQALSYLSILRNASLISSMPHCRFS